MPPFAPLARVVLPTRTPASSSGTPNVGSTEGHDAIFAAPVASSVAGFDSTAVAGFEVTGDKIKTLGWNLGP